MALKGSRVIVIGGTSGIGLAVSAGAAADGASVVVASRSKDRLATLDGVRGEVLDARNESELRAFLEAEGEVDHLVYTAGEGLLLTSLNEVTQPQAREFFETRFWGAFWAAKHAKIRPGGSITLTSATVATRPAPGTAVPAAVMGAVESLTRALAVELAPARIRVNAVRPGPARTSLWDASVPEPGAVLADLGSRIPAGRVGEAAEVAAAYLYLMNSEYSTGTVVTVDGGTTLS